MQNGLQHSVLVDSLVHVVMVHDSVYRCPRLDMDSYFLLGRHAETGRVPQFQTLGLESFVCTVSLYSRKPQSRWIQRFRVGSIAIHICPPITAYEIMHRFVFMSRVSWLLNDCTYTRRCMPPRPVLNHALEILFRHSEQQVCVLPSLIPRGCQP